MKEGGLMHFITPISKITEAVKPIAENYCITRMDYAIVQDKDASEEHLTFVVEFSPKVDVTLIILATLELELREIFDVSIAVYHGPLTEEQLILEGMESLVNIYSLSGELQDDSVVKTAPFAIDAKALVQYAHEKDLQYWQVTTADAAKFIKQIESF